MVDVQRRDLAIVLARGLSRRMGQPKGLMALNPDGETFVRSICRLYASWVPVLVVTSHSDESAYRTALAGLGGVTVFGCEPGGETALTVYLGWQASLTMLAASHLWAHPVDMPQVRADTVVHLLRRSRQQPDAVVRPVTGSGPGHPVVIPVGVVRKLEPNTEALKGPFRDFLRRQRELNPPLDLVEVEVEDPGVVTDFDEPEDLIRPAKREHDV